MPRLVYNPDTDLFVPYLNLHVDNYVSWQPDPYSFAVDGFNISWSAYTNVYAFPPFSLVGPVLTKLRQLRQCYRDHSYSLLDHPVMVFNDARIVDRAPFITAKPERHNPVVL